MRDGMGASCSTSGATSATSPEVITTAAGQKFERIPPAGESRIRLPPFLSFPYPPESASDDRSRVAPSPKVQALTYLPFPVCVRFHTEDGGKIVVALGKFDAMHRGHAELARRASRMGSPILMSFGGMAEVLGWESKLPVVAPGDRARVLDAWKETCEGKTVREHVIPFADIRRMSPEEFVSTLKDIGVGGVVAGANYRFGFKAAGTADTLLELGETLGVDVSIVDLLPANEPGDEGVASPAGYENTPQVSSTRVRSCLAQGDVTQAARLLGRHHSLVMRMKGCTGGGRFPLGAAVNQYPAAGRYNAAVVRCDGVRSDVTAAVTVMGDGDGEIVLEGWDVADGWDGDDVCVEFVGPAADV